MTFVMQKHIKQQYCIRWFGPDEGLSVGEGWDD